MKKNSLLILIFSLIFNFGNIQAQSLFDKIKKKIKPDAAKTEPAESNTEKQLSVAEIKQMVENKKMDYGVYSDQGATSPTHSKYMGKIVFSNSEIKFKNEDESQFKSTFNIDEPLFIQYYLERSIKNEEQPMIDMGARPDFNSIVIYVNGKATAEWQRASWRNPGNDREQWTTNGFPLVTDIPEKQEIPCRTYSTAALGLPAGTHNIKIEMSLVKLFGVKENEKVVYSLLNEFPSHITKIKNVVAVGEFTLNVTDKGKANFVQKFAIKLPKAGQNNPALEEDLKKVAEKSYGNKALKAIIFTPKWEFAKNDIGIITHRYVYALIVSKMPDGTCKGDVFEFGQNKGDGNNYGSTFINGVAGYSEWNKEYTCEAIK